MKLRVLGRYRSSLGSFEPGQLHDCTEEQAALLQRDSPGTFEVVIDRPAGAVGAETVAGIDEVPDRRARGGRIR